MQYRPTRHSQYVYTHTRSDMHDDMIRTHALLLVIYIRILGSKVFCHYTSVTTDLLTSLMSPCSFSSKFRLRIMKEARLTQQKAPNQQQLGYTHDCCQYRYFIFLVLMNTGPARVSILKACTSRRTPAAGNFTVLDFQSPPPCFNFVPPAPLFQFCTST